MAATASVDHSGLTVTRFLKFTFPYIAVHLACLFVLTVGFSWFAFVVSIFVYLARGVGITGFYHRKFSHHAFKTGRVTQFVGAWLGASAAQGGPLWWVAHHRRHHRVSDAEGDIHSPRVEGFGIAHHGWLTRANADKTHLDEVEDLARYRELRWLDQNSWAPILSTAFGLFFAGIAIGRLAPWTGTNGPQLVIWAFFLNTVLLWHVTFAVNSVCHRWGKRHQNTCDDSRNNWLIGVMGLGEGWHNNHHSFPGTSRHGFKPTQLDFTHFVIRTLRRLGLAHDLHPVPERLWLGSKPSRWTTQETKN
ncbi:MAG: acyl-CoA desaturase [Acidimicrobiaceae bacterium]|nr:acyl-CoA desaturase [Acidimicrobiaceae bacterium]